MLTLLRTSAFDHWLATLRDRTTRSLITARLHRATGGNFGDVEAVGSGVSEMKIDLGPGYRIYFARKGSQVYVLLAGGSKKTQPKDIDKAKAIWAEIKRSERHG